MLWALIRDCWAAVPTQRPPMAEVVQRLGRAALWGRECPPPPAYLSDLWWGRGLEGVGPPCLMWLGFIGVMAASPPHPQGTALPFPQSHN